MAQLALGKAREALPLAERAEAELDDLLAARQDLAADEGSRLRHVDALHQRALASVSTAVVRLVEGAEGARVAACEDLRRAHTAALEAQLHYTRLAGDAYSSWDSILGAEISPFRLLFAGAELPGLSIERGLAVQRDLASCMAAVAASEMPGFAAAVDLDPEWADPLADPRRRFLLESIQAARLDDCRASDG